METIRKLAEKYPLFIVSNCQCGYIEVMIESSGIGPFIRDHLCFGETGTPKSETIRALMDRNDLKDVVYVGDTQGDADACRDAGVPFVFAEYGFGDVRMRKRGSAGYPTCVRCTCKKQDRKEQSVSDEPVVALRYIYHKIRNER